ncbi:MAG: NAD(P)H-dependent oxidoreductase [Methylococcales bacterium]|nr:NAD(P)H-dependent oxidoreductase [Methylococcales bacterium]
MAQILILNGNPKQQSLCKSLAESYAQSAVDGGSDVKIIHISELDFDINLKEGLDKEQVLENDLRILQNNILESSHIVIFTPLWWGSMPAKLKGLFDRAFLPGFACKYEVGSSTPKPLLVGKTARIIVTMDTPVWYFRWVLGDPVIKLLKKSILEFCGIQVKGVSRFGPVISSTDIIRNKWIKSIQKAASNDSVVNIT